jgi:phosphoglycerate dehydrogenase-like enzyme
MVAEPLVVTFPVSERTRAVIADALGDVAPLVYLADVPAEGREAALRAAGAVLANDTSTELSTAERQMIGQARLLQFTAAGIDWVPLLDLPPQLPVAGNGGASAEPMAEHIVAVAFAAAKRLFAEHDNLKRGEFNQRSPNKMLRGGVCGILGLGGVGVATARLMRGIGMKVHAINRSGKTDESIDWIGTPDRLDEMLRVADVFVVCLALTRHTEGMIGARELGLMKEDAILINVARGEIIDEAALYAHLVAHPRFTAGIDAWWTEPVRHQRFAMDFPFLDLPNVIGSPHNSAGGGVWRDTSLRRAVENCRRALSGETPLHLARDEERMR